MTARLLEAIIPAVPHAAPTPDPQLNAVLAALVNGAQAVLGENFCAAYLTGSFAVGDWDPHSDVDFMIVTQESVPEAGVPALNAMHAGIFALPSPWAQHLEGSYFPGQLLRRADAQCTPLLYLDNGSQAVVPSPHDNTLVVRWVTREHGITLAGAPPTELIEPVPVEALKHEVRATMHEWGAEIVSGQYSIANRWAQPFAVLSYCRMLHTLACGRVESKPAGMRWALENLPLAWHGLIAAAWAERPDPAQKVRQPADPAAAAQTLEFIAYCLERAAAAA